MQAESADAAETALFLVVVAEGAGVEGGARGVARQTEAVVLHFDESLRFDAHALHFGDEFLRVSGEFVVVAVTGNLKGLLQGMPLPNGKIDVHFCEFVVLILRVGFAEILREVPN
jgi:hypothetical protein